jgi:iron complex outermembrane receptor protein
MNKLLSLSLVAISALYGADVTLDPIEVESTIIEDVAQNAQTSADLSEALSENVPSIDMSRRSGIANDIFIRGQKRDNISVVVDGTKVCGACPNRMDPPVSHILASQIDSIEVTEGPYDVEDFGVLSGGIKVETKKPSQKLHEEVNFAYGSFNYRKVGATVSGGNEKVRVLVSASSESSDQYKDGNGNTLSGQIDALVAENPTDTNLLAARYKPEYKDMQAYSKRSMMAKAFIQTAENQELRLSATFNRSTDVLYANSKMDANYDDSNIYSAKYIIKDIGKIYKKISVEAYSSDVKHPMGTDYRMSSFTMPIKTHTLTTSMQGIKIKNNLELADTKLLIGLDGSRRGWDGIYYTNNVEVANSTTTTTNSLDNTLTDNVALFAKADRKYGALNYSVGARYDLTHISTDDSSMYSRDYHSLSANLFTTYALTKQAKIFFGLGHSTRVPDARELFFKQNAKTADGTKFVKVAGTNSLDRTTNDEIDLGFNGDFDSFNIKVKGFYSKLGNYIYYEKNLPENNFVNLDATVYGFELSGSYYINDDTTLDLSGAYKRGTKDNPAAGEDKDLADMAPLRTTVALNYEYAQDSLATVELKSSAKWDKIDSTNGEQEINAWNVVNAKVKYAVEKTMFVTFGVNNIFDETYAQSNTYADLILVTSTEATTMLLNESGRYFYTNLDFKF